MYPSLFYIFYTFFFVSSSFFSLISRFMCIVIYLFFHINNIIKFFNLKRTPLFARWTACARAKGSLCSFQIVVAVVAADAGGAGDDGDCGGGDEKNGNADAAGGVDDVDDAVDAAGGVDDVGGGVADDADGKLLFPRDPVRYVRIIHR